MYKIEIVTKQPVSVKRKEVLAKSVQEADETAMCQIKGRSYVVTGGGSDPQVVSYLLGILMGSSSSSEIEKLQLLFDR
ncbi:MAG: hypothetical protein HFH33_13400 [Eubacterium sp.]|jgi:hypothetical protein|nr:hypothetical protein [Eubacterium sp.]